MKHIVLGTAGHVDHGKTALIKALTGIDTDRLKEEKERGITIDLGFASLALESGQTFGIVDVPGHERFIKNMVAGAGGIDLVVMVIAADEGVMPQTREHLHICSLLGIKRGLVALTKIDLVDKDWLELVTDDVLEFLEGTFLEPFPVVPVSAVSGVGLPEFLVALDQVSSEMGEEYDTGIFRLPVDRVFTIKGFGTVVTGTLISGQIKAAEVVEILPKKLPAKIRGIQVHNQSVDFAHAGQRTAINLQGVEKATIERGNVLTLPGTLEPSSRLDVSFEYLSCAGRKLKNRSLVRFHTGTSEIIARMILLNRDAIEPGENCYAQLVLESPAVTMTRDRFVTRDYSPVTTIGGGMIIDPLPRKHKRYVDNVLHECALLREGTPEERTATIIERAGFGVIDIRQLVMRTGIRQSSLRKILDKMFAERQAVLVESDGTKVVSFSIYENLQQKILQEVRSYHEKFPLKEGLPKEELKTTLKRFVSRLFNIAIKDLEKNGKIVADRENIRLPGHTVNLEGELEELRGKIFSLYLNAGLKPPYIKEVWEKFAGRKVQAENVLNVMVRENVLIKVNEDLYFDRDALDKLREDYKNLLRREGKATPASFKSLTGLSRKFIIPLMEYFDVTKLTIRAGEHRILREREVK
ncbi:MAG: selenocysteine-specific translation elongation factor [Syntrophales bacterium]